MKKQSRRFYPIIFCVFLFIPKILPGQSQKPVVFNQQVLQDMSGDTTRGRLITSTADEIVVNYITSPLYFQKIADMKVGNNVVERIQCKNTVTVPQPGKPILPVIPVKIILPSGSSIQSISLTYLETRVLPEKHTIEYGDCYYPLRPLAVPVKIRPDSVIYSSDNAFPASPYDLVTIQQKYGCAIAHINVYPVMYYPLSKSIVYAKKLNLTVNLKKDPHYSESQSLIQYPNRITTSMNGIENLSALQTYVKQVSPLQQPTSFFVCDPREEYSWVLITSETLKKSAAAERLLEHRRNQGKSSIIVSVEEIKRKFIQGSVAEKVKEFIREAYNNWKTEYIVLGGNSKIIPGQMVESEEPILSDMYYSCLENKPNDLTSEVFVGRLPVQNASELTNIVNKIIEYETMSNTDPALNKVLFVSSANGFGSTLDKTKQCSQALYMGQIFLDKESTQNHWMSFAQNSGIAVGFLHDSDALWNKKTILDSIMRSGTTIINYIGAGSITTAMRLDLVDAVKCRNKNYFLSVSTASYSGFFVKQCFATAITVSSMGGCWAAIHNSSDGWISSRSSSTDGPSQRIVSEFWHAFFSKSTLQIGKMLVEAHESNLYAVSKVEKMRNCILASNLFGDPASPVRINISPEKAAAQLTH